MNPQRRGRWSAVLAGTVIVFALATSASAAQSETARSSTTVAHSSGGWSKPVTVDTSRHDLIAISCASATFCVALNPYGSAFGYSGSWSKAAAIDKGSGTILRQLTDVSCASTTACVAGDEQDNVVSFNGKTWSAPTQVDTASGGSFFSLSCRSASSCVAVDGAGDGIALTGSTWSKPTKINTSTTGSSSDAFTEATAVSCASTTFCVAIDGSYFSSTFNGKVWSAPENMWNNSSKSQPVMTTISCGSTTFCVAGGASDNVRFLVTYNGKSWSKPLSADPEGTGFDSISCASAKFCMAVDTEGRYLTYSNGSWSKAQNSTFLLTAVSCPTSSFCGAISDDGLALTWRS